MHLKKSGFIIILLLVIICLSAQSKGSLFLRSLIVPGWGQVHSGRNYGYAMMASELAVISSLYYFDNEQKLKSDEAYDYAMKFAHIAAGNYSDEYFAHLSRYSSSGFEAGGYNAMIREQAMVEYPGQPDMQQQYIDANIYPDDLAWNWESDSKRRNYGDIRGDMNRNEEYAKIFTGVLILNHIVSAVDILRLDSEKRRTNISFGVMQRSPMLYLDYKF